QYEENGQDYPYAFVRWTEQRNLQAFLSLVASGKIDVQALITHRFAIEQAARAYTLIQGRTGEPFMGVLLTYPSSATPSTTIDVNVQPDRPSGASASKAQRPVVDRVRVGVLGAGSFAN